MKSKQLYNSRLDTPPNSSRQNLSFKRWHRLYQFFTNIKVSFLPHRRGEKMSLKKNSVFPCGKSYLVSGRRWVDLMRECGLQLEPFQIIVPQAGDLLVRRIFARRQESRKMKPKMSGSLWTKGVVGPQQGRQRGVAYLIWNCIQVGASWITRFLKLWPTWLEPIRNINYSLGLKSKWV